MNHKKILFDIIHPANVHYFKFTIKRLKENGHQVIVTARDKEVTYELLDYEGIRFYKMGKNWRNTFGKVVFLFWCELKTFLIFLRYKPDISLSFGASYIAHNSFLFGIPHIALDDTEHATLNRKLYLTFTDLVLTPDSFLLNLGAKHVKFPGHMELFYLSKKYFRPDISIYDPLGLKPNERFVLIRFVSWNALHDKGQSGLSDVFKLKLVKELNKIVKVYISSEGEMPDELERFRLKIPPQLIHHVLYFAELFIGEGATMASECAALGTPAIYVNSLNAGTLINQEKEGLIHNYRSESGVLELAFKILNNPNKKKDIKNKLKELNKHRIELTDFLFWLILNYPESKKTIFANNNWIKQFKLN